MKNKKSLLSKILLIIILVFVCLFLVTQTKQIATPENNIESNQTEVITIDNNEEKINIKSSEDIDLAKARKKYKNDDIIGRLEIPDLFNILITQSKDNNFYLDHSLSRKKDVKGTEFLDYRNKVTDKQINIYGHNSRTYNIPFRKLEKFKNKEYFAKNEYIIFQSDSGRRYYHILAIKEVSGAFEHMKITKTGQDFVEHVKVLESNAIQSRKLEYDENSNILVLQTCSYGKQKTYYVITAIEIKGYTE